MKIKLMLAGILVAVWGSCLPAGATEPVIVIKAQPFPLNQVRLLDSPFKKAMETSKTYFRKLEADLRTACKALPGL